MHISPHWVLLTVIVAGLCYFCKLMQISLQSIPCNGIFTSTRYHINTGEVLFHRKTFNSFFCSCTETACMRYYCKRDKTGIVPRMSEKYVPLIDKNAAKEKHLFHLLLLLWNLILKSQPENCTCLRKEVLMLFVTPHQTPREHRLEKGKKRYHLLTAWIPAAWVPHIWFGRK